MYAFFSSMVFRKWETNRIGRFRGTKNIPTSFYIWRTGFVHPRELGGNEKRKIGRRKYLLGREIWSRRCQFWQVVYRKFFILFIPSFSNQKFFGTVPYSVCVLAQFYFSVISTYYDQKKKSRTRFDMRRVQSFSTYPFYGRPSSIGLFLLRLNLEGFDLVKKNIFFSLRPSVCQLVLQIVVPPILHIPPNICTSIVQRNWLWSKECSCEIWKFILFLFNGIPK